MEELHLHSNGQEQIHVCICVCMHMCVFWAHVCYVGTWVLLCALLYMCSVCVSSCELCYICYVCPCMCVHLVNECVMCAHGM